MELKSFLPSIYGGSSERVPFRALHHKKILVKTAM